MVQLPKSIKCTFRVCRGKQEGTLSLLHHLWMLVSQGVENLPRKGAQALRLEVPSPTELAATVERHTLLQDLGP